MITRAQRKAIREAGPYRFDNEGVLFGGVFVVAFSGDTEHAVLAALNAIAWDPESVAAARERLLWAALLHDTYEPIRILEAAGAYQAAPLAAKRAKRGRK